ncbi:MAG: hypothetical protein ABJH82_01325 [Polaribacter sp.]
MKVISHTIVEVPSNLSIASVCPDNIELNWDPVAGVSPPHVQQKSFS